jgi:signal transduction histidine kinase
MKQTIAQTEINSQAGLITDLLKLFLHTQSKDEFLDNCLQMIRKWADLPCAGIRILDAQNNIPYHVHCGFSADFIESEKWLSTGKDHCACVRVAQGVLESQDSPQMTEGGSFCCNDTDKYMTTLTESEKARFRGVCITRGYQSLAVIPIRYRQQMLGVLHMVDTRKGAFPPSKIHFLESSVAAIIGEGLYRYAVEDRLEQNLKTQIVLSSILHNSLDDLPLENILNLTLDLIHAHKPFSRVIKSAVFLVENNLNKMSLKVSRNFSDEELIQFSSLNLGDGSLCCRVANNQELVFSACDARGFEATENIQGVIKSYCVPIVYRKNTVGVIIIYLDHGHRRDETEERFLKSVANTLAGIIWRKNSEELLRALSLRLVTIQEEERRGIALELHDQIGQMLTGLKLMISQSVRSPEKERTEVLQEAQKAVTELIVKVRDMSLNLRPSMLDDLGLLPALIWHFQRCKTQSNLNVDFRHSGLEITFPKDVAIAAYRIVQEALTNVMRYAGVNEVLVEVWIDVGWLQIRIEDKGKGFNSKDIAPGSSLGLQGMKERALLLGGNLTVDSFPNQGTVVFAQLPLNNVNQRVTISTKLS